MSMGLPIRKELSDRLQSLSKTEKPVSRDEAIAICDKILVTAGQERLDVAEEESKRGIDYAAYTSDKLDKIHTRIKARDDKGAIVDKVILPVYNDEHTSDECIIEEIDYSEYT